MKQAERMSGIIGVDHTKVDGYHEFTSAQIPGLYVVCDDQRLEAAYNDVCAIIQELIFADHGQRVAVRQVATFEEYIETLPEGVAPARRHYEVEPLAA